VTWPDSAVGPADTALPLRAPRVLTSYELSKMEHGDATLTVASSPDGTRLATASRDKTARLWAV
jgi:WD40 repeat protein